MEECSSIILLLHFAVFLLLTGISVVLVARLHFGISISIFLRINLLVLVIVITFIM